MLAYNFFAVLPKQPEKNNFEYSLNGNNKEKPPVPTKPSNLSTKKQLLTSTTTTSTISAAVETAPPLPPRKSPVTPKSASKTLIINPDNNKTILRSRSFDDDWPHHYAKKPEQNGRIFVEDDTAFLANAPSFTITTTTTQQSEVKGRNFYNLKLILNIKCMVIKNI